MDIDVEGSSAHASLPLPAPARIAEVLTSHIADPNAQWSLGTFGALAEFSRDPGEPAALGPFQAVTGRGALSLTRRPDLRLVAFETVTKDSWSPRVALCLPRDASAMHQRTVLTELGPDREALRAEDRESILFDVGLGAWQADVCIRVRDPHLTARLREHCGRETFAAGSPAARLILETSPHRVFISRLGRIEVYQPIPPAHGKSPEGPHTHVLPDLLRHRRTHAATEPISADLVPCAHLYPAHPAKDAMGYRRAFDAQRLAAFDAMLREFGDPQFIALKARVRQDVAAGGDPASISLAGRFTRTTIRVALRQLRDAGDHAAAVAQWMAVHDAASARRDEASSLVDADDHVHHR